MSEAAVKPKGNRVAPPSVFRRYGSQMGIIGVGLAMWAAFIIAAPTVFLDVDIYKAFAQTTPLFGPLRSRALGPAEPPPLRGACLPRRRQSHQRAADGRQCGEREDPRLHARGRDGRLRRADDLLRRLLLLADDRGRLPAEHHRLSLSGGHLR